MLSPLSYRRKTGWAGLTPLVMMGRATGFEPVISCATDRRLGPLGYARRSCSVPAKVGLTGTDHHNIKNRAGWQGGKGGGFQSDSAKLLSARATNIMPEVSLSVNCLDQKLTVPQGTGIPIHFFSHFHPFLELDGKVAYELENSDTPGFGGSFSGGM